jgi:hypothetical protein
MLLERIETTATIAKDTHVIAQGVAVVINVEVEPPGRLMEWHGWVEMPGGAGYGFLTKGTCRITLLDGRSGDVFATHVEGDDVEFQGSGPLA